MVKELRQNQLTAVTGIVQCFRGTRPPVALSNGGTYKYPKQRAVIAYGGTGCGKTCISRAAAVELGEKRVLVIVPPCGGVVFDQWLDELADSGVSDTSCLYHGPARIQTLSAWRSRCEADESAGVHFVVTSIATLHADATNLLKARFPDRCTKPDSSDAPVAALIRKRGKKYTDEETRWAFQEAASALGGFDLLILDEFQEFRNGSPPTDEKKAIDPTKTQYMMLDAIAAHSRPLVLGLSATPIVNSSGELFSFLRLAHGAGTHDQSAKFALLERTRLNPDPDVKRLFKEESRRIRSHMIVPVEAPVVPATTYQDVKHEYTLAESSVLSLAYGELYNTTFQFLSVLIAFLEAPDNPARRATKDLWKNRFLSLLTHSKRLTIAPLCFKRPRERANPNEDPQIDSLGRVVTTTDADGNEVPLGRLLPFDVAAAHAAVPIEAISKFKTLVDDLAQLKDRRAMILCEFSDPIELLALYLRDAFPGRAIFRFHGGVHGRDKQLAGFKEGPSDAILLATRGACGMAVNVECTTVADGRRHAVVQYQLDLPMSQSLQDQAEGRIKRPIAQGHPSDADKVEAWIVKKVRAKLQDKNTLEDWLEAVMSVKNARCSDMLVDKDEQRLEGKEVATDTNEGLEGPLKKLLEVMVAFAPPREEKKRKQKNALRGEKGLVASRKRLKA